MIFQFSLKRRIQVILFFAAISVCSYQAQPEEAFSKVSLGLNVSENVNRGLFHQYWNSQKAVNLYASTNLRYGFLDVGLTYNPFLAKSNEQPDFHSFFIYMQWSAGINIFENTDLKFGGRAGMFQMIFDKTEEYSASTDLFEHEITLGLSASIIYRVKEKLALELNTSYQSILFRKKIDLYYTGLGIIYTFETPAWLKELIE